MYSQQISLSYDQNQKVICIWPLYTDSVFLYIYVGVNKCKAFSIYEFASGKRGASSTLSEICSLFGCIIAIYLLTKMIRYCFTTESHPCPPKPDPVKSLSSSLNNLTPAKFTPVINNGSPTILGKRSYEQHNGMDGKYFLVYVYCHPCRGFLLSSHIALFLIVCCKVLPVASIYPHMIEEG